MIITVAVAKGGVGKSVVARVISQYFIDHQIPFTGFDSDRSHGSLLRFYKDYASPVVVDRYESLDAIVEAAQAINGPAGNPVYIDIVGHPDEPRVGTALRALREACAFFKVLGTYPIDVH